MKVKNIFCGFVLHISIVVVFFYLNKFISGKSVNTKKAGGNMTHSEDT